MFSSYPPAVQAKLGGLTREYRVLASGAELIALGMRDCNANQIHDRPGQAFATAHGGRGHTRRLLERLPRISFGSLLAALAPPPPAALLRERHWLPFRRRRRIRPPSRSTPCRFHFHRHVRPISILPWWRRTMFLCRRLAQRLSTCQVPVCRSSSRRVSADLAPSGVLSFAPLD